MKWFKHDSGAHLDAKLQKLRIKYGLEGYGLYFYCLELIAMNVDEHNLTFELEHDSEIIAFNTGIHYERVQDIISTMVDLELFENNNGMITCYKLASRLDQSMTSNANMRKMIAKIKENHDGDMTKSGKGHDGVMTESCKKRIEENRREDKKEKRPTASTLNFNEWPSQPDKQLLDDWLKQRKSKKASNTQRAIDAIGKQITKASEMGFTVDEILELCLVRGWTGFESDWLTNNKITPISRPAQKQRKSL